MISPRTARRLLCTLAALCALGALAPAAEAAAGPAWALDLGPLPSNLNPGGTAEYYVLATDVGAGPTTAAAQIEATLPEALTPIGASPPFKNGSCTLAAHSVTCQAPQPIGASRELLIHFKVAVSPSASGALTATATVSGGGAATVSRSASAPAQPGALPFGFSGAGLQGPFTAEDGTAAALAGSHPYQQTVSFGFATEFPEDLNTNSGHPREVKVDLPAGFVANPTATPLLCTEAQFVAGICPDSSQLGIFTLTTLLGGLAEGENNLSPFTAPIYNMVPPPGYPAELATEVGGLGIALHLLPSVRSDGDYGIEVTSPDVLALGTEPYYSIQTQIWGDPSAPAHEHVRGGCLFTESACAHPLEPQSTAFWTLPGHCTAQPDPTSVAADSWEQPGLFKQTEYESADLAGSPVSVSGCAALQFEPTISAQPTTNLTDSPSGLDVDLHQPQHTELGENGGGRATAQLKDATVTLPAGMVVNPSQADGLGACTSAQIGLTTQIGATPIHFDKTPNACPAAAKLGTVEVTTPLLAQYSADGTEPVLDPETGKPIPRPLQGSVYLAKPFDNPFGSLLAIYLAVEDPQSGTVAKLAGRIEPDPVTGQLTTRFDENPQLPLEDVRLHFYPGARASLITPPTCGAHTTSTDLVPWSSPEGADAHPQSSFQSTATPGGGACPTSEAGAPNAPSFLAGTIGREAGAYSPFVLKLSREDGSQRMGGIETTLPPGLAAKFAGVPYCSEAQIAAAQARSHPDGGILERQHPSCPAASEVGTVNVGAGAGPTPFYTSGHVYLAGPYKGAPLSLVIITPAIAGPFDLGAVVVRTALYVDPFTAQGRAVSDPLPQILDGIPLDIRSVALRIDRPDFTLNPTSCDPLAITGNAFSALGQSAALSTPFQVGGCSALAFKPKLSLKLKGGTKRSDLPSLTAKLTYPKGGPYANIASAQVNLPHSEFLEQSHIGTVCTRPQLASHTCPAKSVYGYARAVTPLLEKPLEGPVYLGVGFGHKLPDLVADLNGQIEVLLHGKTDTGPNKGLRNTFQVVPDAPVTSFTLRLFGGKRGLIVNSENLCGPRAKTQALAHFVAQNGKVLDLKPKVQNECGGKGKGTPKAHKRASAR